jgi:general secretion pathway protein E
VSFEIPDVPAPAGVHRGLREILLRDTRLTLEQLEEALRRKQETGKRLLEAIVDLGHLNEEEVLEAVGKQLALPVRPRIEIGEIDEALVERVPIGFAKNHGLLPVGRTPQDAIRVVVSDPFDTACLDDLRLLFDGARIETELASRRNILATINQVYDRGTRSIDDIVEDATDDFVALAEEISAEPQDLLDSDDDAPIIRLVDSLLQRAVKERASDVHLEPFEKEIRVRFRVDDLLYEPVSPLPKALLPSHFPQTTYR